MSKRYSIQELFDLDKETVARMQYDALQEHMVSVLYKVKANILNPEAMNKLCFHSPSGDCMGLDNMCINFAFKPNEQMDIMEATNLLASLWRTANGDEDC